MRLGLSQSVPLAVDLALALLLSYHHLVYQLVQRTRLGLLHPLAARAPLSPSPRRVHPNNTLPHSFRARLLLHTTTMPPRATAIARSPSPGLDTSNEDIVRLAYDTEEELLELFVRMREQLKERVKSRVEEEKGKGEKVDEKKVEGVVLKVSAR